MEGARPVRARLARREGAELRVDLGPLARGVRPRDSIAVSGVCLTVEAVRGKAARFFVSRETLRRTTLGALRSGDAVNLERAARLGDRLGGHLVTGHVDGTGRVRAVRRLGEGTEAVFEVEARLGRYLVPKGSIAIDGVSLTVAARRGRRFRVALVPETLHRTTLATLRVGGRVNVEVDLLGKWVEALTRAPRTARRRRSRSAPPRGRPRSGGRSRGA